MCATAMRVLIDGIVSDREEIKSLGGVVFEIWLALCPLVAKPCIYLKLFTEIAFQNSLLR